MDHIEYTPQGVCSRKIDIDVEDGIITKVKFSGGCAGNTQGVASLLVGMTVDDAIERLSGIRCGFKSTSCPDQLSKALLKYKGK
ncbi:MAG: TIGR03905 family TSCPD domain-containing protein [Ruminococcaceae bacterium]|nr:TIGR03905 family TSCPD domain-containing protein [Oscillospiraceae bacterium]